MIFTNWLITQVKSEDFFSRGLADLERLDWRPVEIPCNVQNSPFGQPLPGLYQGDRVKEVEWMRERVWLYRTSFSGLEIKPDEEAVYQFLGIDYFCEIYLKSKKVAEHEGMFSTVEVPLDDLKEHNDLIVAILPFTENRSYPENAKARFSTGNGWDFAPKIQSAGIWDEAGIFIRKNLRISSVFIGTHLANQQRADVTVTVEFSQKIEYGVVTIDVDGARRTCPVVQTDRLAVTVEVFSPRLWWPNGMGDAQVVDIKVWLEVDGQAVDFYTQRTGLREISRIPCQGQGQHDIPLQLVINGRKVFIQGVNWVPPDACPASITIDRYRLFLHQFHQAGVNFIRVWGGGLKEKDSFYSLCDELGLMVMQEFPLACQKIARSKQFYQVLEQEATAILKSLRSHPCVVLWSGGNEHYHYWDTVDSGSERMEAIKEPVKVMFDLGDTDHENREWRGGCPKYEEPALVFLGNLCNLLDGTRPYQITSAMEGEGEVHGIWNWNPAIGDHRFRDYESLYAFWLSSRAHLYSECSVSSIANRQMIDFILDKKQKDIPSTDDPIWILHHAFHSAWDKYPDLWLDIPSTERLFGKLDDLDSLILANQWMQAEGARFIVDEIKRRIGQTSGVIWWGVNEPWPSLAGNSLIDYFGNPKPGWLALRNAFCPVTISIRYDHCLLRRVKPEVWVSNISSGEFIGNYEVILTNMATGQVDQYEGSVNCDGYHSVLLRTLLPVRLYQGVTVKIDCHLYDRHHDGPVHSQQYYLVSQEDEAPLRHLLSMFSQENQDGL